MSNASLSFLPWVRQGAAAAITVPDAPGWPVESAVASVAPALTLNGAPLPAVSIRLRGPGDVVGIDANQVVRMDPRPGTTDFEPNYFPCVEFDRADFPWLFTPARADQSARLKPWLCLVVVRKQAGVAIVSNADSPLPILQIGTPARPDIELPDLKDCWAWAHSQVAADDNSAAQVGASLNGASELSLSRLICPRILAPDTDYLACVVPTYELGRKAGLGTALREIDLTAANALAPAWSFTPKAPAPVLLPVYFQWEFRTGEGGDFESLARRLRPMVADGLGKRIIDVSQPGFASAGATTAELEGALLPMTGLESPAPPSTPLPMAFREALAGIINEPGLGQAVDSERDPLLAPPIYGRWHAAKATVSPSATAWLDQLNLDPRWRVAAACGTRVVQQHQEALMASAWEQAADMQVANQRRRQLQMSLTVGEVLHKRHFAADSVSEEMMLRMAAPAFSRLRYGGQSLLEKQSESQLPIAANRSAMRRIGRHRGPLSRRIAAQGRVGAQGFERSAADTWVARLNDMGATQSTSLEPSPELDMCILPPLPTEHLARSSFFGAFFVAPEQAPMIPVGVPVLELDKTEKPGFFRAAALEHLGRFLPPRSLTATSHRQAFPRIKHLVLAQMQPKAALSALAKAVITTGDNIVAAAGPGSMPSGMDTIMAAPSFDQPMYETLRELSQDFLLPGLEKVAPDTVVGLKSNRRFIEAFMVGLNHEMGRELLWRGYPTDQRGTYFDRFWEPGNTHMALPDIDPLHSWGMRSLGGEKGAPAGKEFVMLIRSNLLQRYPNAVIYLTPALSAGSPQDPDTLFPDDDPAHELAPLFSGSMEPDVRFFGFPVTTRQAIGGDGDPGYYVVFQEHPTEPRFGLDADVSDALKGDNISHLAIGSSAPAGHDIPPGYAWNKNAAHTAAITRQLPVRLAIHASRLVTPA